MSKLAAISLVVATLLTPNGLVDGFQSLAPKPKSIFSTAMTSSTTDSDDLFNIDQASKWKAEAQRIRLEAAQLDSALTSQKIETLERKLADEYWLGKNPEEAQSLQQRLDSLRNKVSEKEEPVAVTTPVVKSTLIEEENRVMDLPKPAPKTETKKDTGASDNNRYGENPFCGYDQEDLELYVPIVTAIDERLPSNATLIERLEAFRAAPELQEHFQEKIRKLLVEPMEDMARLESLKQQYLSSSSSVERKQLKREMEQLEKTADAEGPFVYSDTVILEDLPRLEEEEIQQRLEAVGALHPMLQALYKQRCGINEEEELRLAIEMEHFEPQLQLLEQVRYLDPMTDDIRHEMRLALLSLPTSVRDKFARNTGLENGEDIAAIIEELIGGEGEQWMTLQQAISSSKIDGDNDDGTSLNLPEYSDLDFMDRSRYVGEFLPSVKRLEMIHPPTEEIDALMKEVLGNNKAFMVTSPPERVIGGYYIRGHNMMSDPESGSTDDMVQFLQEKLQQSSLKDKIDLFYIQDPSPPTDEEYELELLDRPVLLVTAKNRDEMYDYADPAIKVAVSLLGLCGVLVFGLATSEMQPLLRDQVEAAAAGDLSVDISPIFDSASQVAVSMIAIQMAHELGHRVVAWKDKFDVCLPTLVPSIQLGLQGAITPFKSPPPSNKSMFDFAIAGPIAGLVVSFALLIAGLDLTASMDIASSNLLPAFPVSILRSSTLGGGMVEFFIGKGTLMKSPAESVLPLHPFAIAGFVGMISNSLALLPLGNTDGGRIAQVMFGRRGAYIVIVFATLLLCLMGIFGLDEPRILLTYVLFTMIWQRDLESPALNEADELDFGRGLVGIGSAAIVILTLLPML